MRARFVGDPRDGGGPENLTVHGLAFVKGGWRDVPDDVAGKLATHSHFEVQTADIPDGAAPIDDWRALNKAELDAYAEGLGIKLDRRKSLTKMKADYEAALGG